jgi:hypothetical protein
VDIQRVIHLLSTALEFSEHHDPSSALEMVGVGDFYRLNMSVMEGVRTFDSVLRMVFQ